MCQMSGEVTGLASLFDLTGAAKKIEAIAGVQVRKVVFRSKSCGSRVFLSVHERGRHETNFCLS